MSLDFKNSEFKALLDQSSEMILELFSHVDHMKGYHAFTQDEVESWFEEPLPESGMDGRRLLEEVQEKILNTATGNLGPHMYAYVMAGGNQVSIIAEKLAATINQNAAKWHLGPAMSEIEKRVVQWAGEMMGYPGTGGVMISGGSEANLVGLTVARNIYYEERGIKEKGLFGQKPFTVYASREVHSCIDKSVNLLGIGTDHLRKVDTNPDFTIDLNALKKQIEQDISDGFEPFCIIGTAGTVNTGAIDDLDSLATIASEHKMWFHIDGAYGGLAASLPELKAKYRGIEKGNSLAVDFHKWLYQPFEAGCLLVKDWSTLKNTYFKKADYLDTTLEHKGRLDFNEHIFQLSRNAKAFKVWMSLKAYGFGRIREMIARDIELTYYLAERIREADDFELKSVSDLAVCCFRFTGDLETEEEIANVNRKLIPALEEDGRVFITGTRLNDEFVIRACLINHRKTEKSTDYLLEVIRDVGEGLVD